MCKREREVQNIEILKSLFVAVGLEISLMSKSKHMDYAYFIDLILSLLYGMAENRFFLFIG